MESIVGKNPPSNEDVKITKYQWHVLIACMLGWGLDGMDGNLFAMVVQPAMRELLGAGATPADIGFYGGICFAMYLIGWATGGIALGVVADYFGRVRVLAAGILIYSIFTGFSALAENWWQLGIYRFLTGVGSGVELAIGASLIAETWNNKYRAKAAGFMMSAFALGFFLSSVVYKLVGDMGWRPVFWAGVLPALSVFYILSTLKEPEVFQKVQEKRKMLKQATNLSAEDKEFVEFPLKAIFKGEYRKHTIVCTTMSVAALLGFWAIGGWIPMIARELLVAAKTPQAELVSMIAYASMAYNFGGFVGYSSWGFIAEKLKRKGTFFLNMTGSLIIGPVLFLNVQSFSTYLIGLFFLGFSIMGFFAGCAVYFPELYPSRMRATAITVINNTARYITAFGPFVVGMLVPYFGSFAKAAAAASGIFVIGLIALYFAKETHGQPMPDEKV